MPGFRQGKVPASLVKKMYGKAVKLEEINKIMSEELTQYLSNADFKILGDPLPGKDQETLDLDNGETFDFKFDIAMSPEVDVKLTKRDKIKYYSIKIDDELIDKQIEAYASRLGAYKQVEEIQSGDVLRCDIGQLNADGNIAENGIIVENVVVAPDRLKDDKAKALFMSATKGVSIDLDPKIAFENATEISSMLKISKAEVEQLSGLFRFTVVEITRYENAEVNQDLFDKVYGEGAVLSVEEFRGRVAEDLKKGFESNSDYRFSIDAKEKLLSKVSEVVMPEEFLKRWLTEANKDNDKVTPEMIENEFSSFIEDLKYNMVKSSIAKANDIKINEEDVKIEARKLARAQFAQYGLNNVSDSDLEHYVLDMLKQQDQARNLSERALETKVLAVVKEAVKLDETEVSSEEFNKLFE